MELLSRALRSFISGIAFALGVGFVVILWGVGKEYLFPPPSVLVEFPKDVSIVSIEPLTVTVPAGVIATLKNLSSVSAYSPSSYELRILNDGKQLASCEARYANSIQLQPGASAQVQLTCPDVQRSALPTGATYKVAVRSAWRFL